MSPTRLGTARPVAFWHVKARHVMSGRGVGSRCGTPPLLGLTQGNLVTIQS